MKFNILILLAVVIGLCGIYYLYPKKKLDYYVYYIPLEVDFYVPPTRESIMRDGKKIKIPENKNFNKIFKNINNTNLVKTKADVRMIRIMIVNPKNIEIFITQDKKIVSYEKRTEFKVSLKSMNNVLEIINIYR